MNPEMIFGGILYLGVIGFFAWIFWVIDEKHPERLDRLRQELGVIDKHNPPD